MAMAPRIRGPATTAAATTRARESHTAATLHAHTRATPALPRTSRGTALPRITPAAGIPPLPRRAITSSIPAAILVAAFLPMAAARIITPAAAHQEVALGVAPLAVIIQVVLRTEAHHHLATAAAVTTVGAAMACTDALEDRAELHLEPLFPGVAPARAASGCREGFSAA